MTKKIAIYVFGLFFLLSFKTHAQVISGQISKIGDATHLQWSGRSEWFYDDPVKEGTKWTFALPAFDQETEKRLLAWTCQHVDKVEINKNGPDNKFLVTFHLKNKEVEVFVYQTDQPPRLIADFYRQPQNLNKPETHTIAKNTTAKNSNSKESKKGRARTEYTKNDSATRSPAGSEIMTSLGLGSRENASQWNQAGVFDGEDPQYQRFLLKDYEIKEEAIIASQQNIYIQFPMLKVKSQRFEELMALKPIYEIQNKNTKENVEARFVLKMYNDKRPASFVESYNYFQKKYPYSEYAELLRNVFAEFHAEKYLKENDILSYEKMRSEYKYLNEKYSDSVLKERNLLLLAYSALHRGDGVEALLQLKSYLDQYPQSNEKNHIKLGQAEAYIQISKPEEALKIYAELEKSESKDIRAQVAFLKGDVYFGQGQYSQAVQAYKEAQARFADYKNKMPNALFNLSEAQFWLKDYKPSLESYVDAIKNYPNHSHSGIAMARIGELIQILSGDQARSTGAYVEGYFRFPQSQGSEVSRIRMLTQALKGMKDKEKERALKEVDEIIKKSKLPRMEEFATLIISDGLSRRDEHEASLKKLVDYYQTHPNPNTQPIFRSRIQRNISDIMKNYLQKNDFMSALTLFGKYSNTWLKNSDRIDIPFYRARALEQAGVYGEALTEYDALLKTRTALDPDTEKRKRVYENLPEASQIQLRLAAVSLQERQFQKAVNHLQNTKSLTEDDEKIERAKIGAEIATHLRQDEQALKFFDELIAQWSGPSEGEDSRKVEPLLSSAEILVKLKRFKEAETRIQNVEDVHKKQALKREQETRLMKIKSDIHFAQGKKREAAQELVLLVEKFEGQQPMSDLRYKAGQIFFDLGEVKEAEKIWSTLSGAGSEFYKNLAQEKLRETEWTDTYKKYLDRIPAAQDIRR